MIFVNIYFIGIVLLALGIAVWAGYYDIPLDNSHRNDDVFIPLMLTPLWPLLLILLIASVPFNMCYRLGRKFTGKK